jgi:hypothetical protein
LEDVAYCLPETTQVKDDEGPQFRTPAATYEKIEIPLLNKKRVLPKGPHVEITANVLTKGKFCT